MRQAYDYWQDQPGNRETHGERRFPERKRRSSRALSTEGPHRPACGTATRLRSSKHAPRFRGTSNEAHSLGTQSTSGLQTRPSSWATPTTSDTSKPRRSPPAYQLHGKGICAHGPTTYSTSPHVERDNNTVHPVRNSPATASRSATDHSHRPT